MGRLLFYLFTDITNSLPSTALFLKTFSTSMDCCKLRASKVRDTRSLVNGASLVQPEPLGQHASYTLHTRPAL